MITEETKPDYYNLEIDTLKFDVFDLVDAIREKIPTFSFRLESALKYIIRIKTDSNEKRINDLEKAKECIDREIKHLKNL